MAKTLNETYSQRWREIKQLLRYKSPNLPIKQLDGRLATLDIEKAELFKDHLANTF
ncbi:Hypothetical protein CINCED_3A000106 [Cinara cedri]|uniref:Uncharacterized protein n=1 Tax=Cinara cedri TaxID=506608 RepID=A0A5E4N2U4_9HEMI|nr:Hypothetical protein CINCED_3A000106 [Cinara cedri]